ncbi:MAG TPA: MBL fold metallo-hydrolase [Thermoanaerobaculia bacterium]|nr:MBL fold metallo-hydrolase [Thermoanaerobaculia bacterium]
MKRAFALLAAALFALSLHAADPQPLPPWSEGMLDIHQISTGRGNAALVIFPDGTTMLVDAGAANDGLPMEGAEPRPNASKRAGEWIVRYIERAMAPRAAHLDYAIVTHYHADHFGQVTTASPASKSGAFKLTGLADVGHAIAIDTIIDRGRTYLKPDDPSFKNYDAFVEEQKAKRGTKNEALRVGRNDQIVLRHAAAKYPTFEVRNVAANGVIWTGEGEKTISIFPPLDSVSEEDKPSENMCSVGLRIRYGKFDFFTGGDIPGVPDAGAPEWQSVETPIARATGATDVHVVNHHGSISPESANWLATLRSSVMILPSWSATHPSQDVLKRMMTARLYPGPHDIFCTVLREPTKLSIGSRAKQVKSDHGHVVVRVAPGGATYQVFVLDDTREDAPVVASYAYESK